jgi:uncharacterized protein (TIGR03437 family)
MNRSAALLLPALLLSVLHAATTNTTLSATATAALNSAGNIDVKGTATLKGIGDGTINETLSLSSLLGTSANVSLPLPIVLSGGTLNLTVTVPASQLLAAGSLSGSATVTGGTGAFANATGSFPSLTGTASGSITAGLSLTFGGDGTVTTGSSGGPTPPTVTAVLDAGSYTSSVAAGSIFVVKGTNLSDTGYASFGFPLPQQSPSGNVQISFAPAGGGSATNAYLIYTYNQNGVNQLAAILPSTVAPGNYNVTVSYKGATSAPFAATVVKNKPGLLTQDATGSGLVLAQNVVSASQYDVDRFTTGSVGGATISPAKPGQTLVVYATGLGPVPGGDNVASSGYDFTQNGVTVQAIVGGVTIPALYAGRTPTLAGLDQINITLPSNVPTGCTVPFQISENGVLSAPTFISIAADASSAACVQPGFTTAQLQNFDQGGTVTAGAFTLSQMQVPNGSSGTVKSDSISGGFARFTGFQLAALAQQSLAISPGSCQVVSFSGSPSQIVAGATLPGLDAGKISLNGPAGSGVTSLQLNENSGNYSLSLGIEGLSLPGSPSVTLVPGTYTLTGAGGADVQSFTASVALASPLTITGGLPSTISRGSALTLNWTGGNATDLVEIIGYSGTTAGSGASQTVNATEFLCAALAGSKTATIPASVLAQLPATTGANATGFLGVFSATSPSGSNGTFQAGLTAGGSVNGIFVATTGTGATATYQ